MLCADNSPRVTQYRVNGHGMYTVDLHIMSLSRFELSTNTLTLFKGVTTVISVVDIDCSSV